MIILEKQIEYGGLYAKQQQSRRSGIIVVWIV
jgi:hypothetical protein